jgi:hypothetical protein
MMRRRKDLLPTTVWIGYWSIEGRPLVGGSPWRPTIHRHVAHEVSDSPQALAQGRRAHLEFAADAASTSPD